MEDDIEGMKKWSLGGIFDEISFFFSTKVEEESKVPPELPCKMIEDGARTLMNQQEITRANTEKKAQDALQIIRTSI